MYKILGLEPIRATKQIPEKLQHTLEREPDFVRVVETEDNKQYILHLEFQSSNDPNMLMRMGEYHALLLRRYNLPIKHYVLYFGDAKPNMATAMPDEKVFTGFTLKNFKDYKASSFLASQSPEEVVMSILADFGKMDADTIIEQTLQRLLELTGGGAMLNKYTHQLTILSTLRKLEKQTKLKVNKMAITLNLNPYKEIVEEAVERAVEKAVEKAVEEGIERGKLDIAKQLITSGEFTLAKIASLTGIPLSTLEKIKDEK